MPSADPRELYLTLHSERVLSPGDAISVAWLTATPHPVGGRYYHALWTALTSGLRLRNPASALSALTKGEFNSDRLFEKIGFGTLLKIRRLILNFCTPFQGVLEGDPWCRPTGWLRDEWRPAMEEARQVYEKAEGEVRQALEPVDRALCEMLGWEFTPTVSVETLGKLPGFPHLTDEQREEILGL